MKWDVTSGFQSSQTFLKLSKLEFVFRGKDKCGSLGVFRVILVSVLFRDSETVVLTESQGRCVAGPAGQCEW